MPILHAALKQMRKDRKHAQQNQAIRSELKTLTKQLLILLKEQKSDEASSLMRLVVKKWDRAASKGVIHRNTASRQKSRLSLQINRASNPKASR